MPNPVRPGDPPTGRQLLVLKYIYETIESAGRRPTIREIMTAFGWSNPNAAVNHMKGLDRRGYIKRKGVMRGNTYAYDLMRLPDGRPFLGFRAVRSDVRCGKPTIGAYAMSLPAPVPLDLPPVESLQDWMRDGIKDGTMEPFHDPRTGEILGYRNCWRPTEPRETPPDDPGSP